MALVACAVVAVVAIGPDRRDGSLASAIAFKQRCAVRYPDPCWQDPLTEAYGRALAGAVRALAPAPEVAARARPGPRSSESTTGAAGRRAAPFAASERLTTANRRTTAFTSIRDDRPLRRHGHDRLLDLPPDDRLGADQPRGRAGRDRDLRRHAAARLRQPGPRPARDAARPRRRPLQRRRGAAVARTGSRAAGGGERPSPFPPMESSSRLSSVPAELAKTASRSSSDRSTDASVKGPHPEGALR